MQISEVAERLGITQRMLRHYEKVGLLHVRRAENGYRSYGMADLRRAARIRDLIATGFSTREILAMRACLDDDGHGPCEGGIHHLQRKLAQIDRLRADLETRRKAVVDRLAMLRASLSKAHERNDLDHDTPSSALPHRLPRGGRRIPAGAGADPHRQ